MPTNDCAPANIYGPQEHTLFLGVSVMSFSASVGWGEQESQLTVKIVEDTCTSATGKIYWDSDLNKQTTYDIDDGFFGEDRWQRTDGSYYSGDQENGSDTLVRSAIELIGLPAYFRIGDFEYSGLIQSWTRDKSATGNPTYTVILTDPRQLLEGSRIIVSDYSGSVDDAYNVINAYGYMEAFGSYCPQFYYNGVAYVEGDEGVDGAIFGSASNGFGGADANFNGMQFSRIITALQLLCSTTPKPDNVWSPYGRLVFKGVDGGGAGLMGYDLYSLSDGYLSEYMLDLSELPTPPSYWRLQASDVSILEFISQLCEDAGYDYYTELIPIRGISSAMALSGIAKIIKIRTVARTSQPSLGQLNSFVENTTGVVSKSTGKELRNETLNAFVVGGPKQVTYQAYQSLDPEADNIISIVPPIVTGVLSQLGTRIAIGEHEIDDLILPYFGKYKNGDVIMPIKDGDGRWQFEAPIDDINNQLAILDITNTGEVPHNRLTINELELQAAAVSYDSLISTSQLLNSDLYRALANNTGTVSGLNSVWGADTVLDLAQRGMELAARDVANPRPRSFAGKHDALGQAQEDLQRVYNWINTYASEFYGKKFQVRVPHTCVVADSESEQSLTSEQPSDGSWTDFSSVIGLVNPSAFLDRFRLEDRRIGNFARFQNASGTLIGSETGINARSVDFSGTFIDTSSFNPDDYGITNNKLYLKCDVENEFVYYDKDLYLSPRVVIEFPETIKKVEDGGQHPEEVRLFLSLADQAMKNESQKSYVKNRLKAAQEGVAGKDADAPMLYPLQMPEAVAIGIKSNTLTYGPWVSGGKPGKVRIDVDEGLVPWEYGGIDVLNTAAQTKADEGLANMQIGEFGRIVAPGYPTVSLGAEINSSPSLIESRSLSSNIVNETHVVFGPFTATYHYLNTSAAVGDNGPNMTDISVNVGPQGAQTTYAMTTYTQRFGRFTKNNAERLKKMGQYRFDKNKQFRNSLLNQLKKFINVKEKTYNRRVAKGKGLSSSSPTEVLVGSVKAIMNSGDGEGTKRKRSIVSLSPISEISTEFNDYENKAFMSLDGLVRPISMDGEGGLPRYASPQIYGGNYTASSYTLLPPVYQPTGDSHVSDFTSEHLIYSNTISTDYLNPFSNPSDVGTRTGLAGRVSATGYVGHDIDLLGRGSGVPESGLIMPSAGFDGQGGADYAEDYRMLGLRGPLVMQSWGYDIYGKPIPNAADKEEWAASGIFIGYEGAIRPHDNFLDGWLKKSHTWPVAPIDLRFDHYRGVWVSPPYYRFLKVTLEGERYAKVLSAPGQRYFGPTGELLDGDEAPSPRIEVYNDTTTSLTFASGSTIMVYFDPEDNQYHPLGNDFHGVVVDVVTDVRIIGKEIQKKITPVVVNGFDDSYWVTEHTGISC